jgi:3'(2'), 5'-bisphosphate nucleotidase
MIDWNDLSERVIAIARDAGAAILGIYANEADFNVEKKSDDSPLTKADRAANTVICDGLAKLPQVFPIISEENKAIPYEERKDFELFWLVDPLDGTKEFIKRNGEFTVNIALVDGQQPVFGVVYAPVLDEVYWAIKGQGAWMLKGDEKTMLHALPFQLSDPGLKVVCSRSHLNEGTQAFIDALDAPEKVSRGSSLKFLLMAKGDAHVYPRLGPTMEWDTGAAQIVLEEAGGSVIDEETKEPLRYNKENLLNPYFIAYGNLGN